LDESNLNQAQEDWLQLVARALNYLTSTLNEDVYI
jgi:hypothetical protein